VRTPSATRTPGAREHEHQHEPDQGLQGPLHQHCLYQVCYTPRAKHEVTKYHTRQGRGQDAVPQAAAPRQRRGAPEATHHEQLAGQLQLLELEGRAWAVQVDNLDRKPLHHGGSGGVRQMQRTTSSSQDNCSCSSSKGEHGRSRLTTSTAGRCTKAAARSTTATTAPARRRGRRRGASGTSGSEEQTTRKRGKQRNRQEP